MFSFLFSLFFIFFPIFHTMRNFTSCSFSAIFPASPTVRRFLSTLKFSSFWKETRFLVFACLAVRRNCRPLRWDTLGNCFASLTEIKSLTMLSETESGKQLCPMMISWPRKKHKLKWFGHVSRSSGLLQGTVQGGRRRCRKKKPWQNNISEWTGLSLRRPKWSWKQNQMEGKGC